MSNPRRLAVTYSITVEFEIPEDFPLTADEVRKTVEWLTNDHTDGRMPFSTETMMHAAGEAARWQIDEAIFHHYCRRVEKAFPRDGNWHLEARNALIARRAAQVRARGVPEHELGVDVKIHPETVTCPNCGQETLKSWRRCPCSPDVLLPGVEPRPWEVREAQRKAAARAGEQRNHCNQCGHEWVGDPHWVDCPACGSPD